MIDLVYKIKNSQPTMIGEEAKILFSSIVTNPKWVVVSSAIFPMEELLVYANTFIGSMARIEIHEQSLLTIQPIHVLYLDKADVTDGWDKTWGLLYSNGAVCYSEKNDGNDQFLVVFLDESLVDPKDVIEIPRVIDEQ